VFKTELLSQGTDTPIINSLCYQFFADFGGSTNLSLTITLWNKQWYPAFSNTGSNEFQNLKEEFIDQVT